MKKRENGVSDIKEVLIVDDLKDFLRNNIVNMDETRRTKRRDKIMNLYLLF